MKLPYRHRPAATLLAALAVVGLAGCGSSDASVDSTPAAPVATIAPPVTTVTPTTMPPATTVAVSSVPGATTATEVPTSAANGTDITEADVADLEQQLDEIDQLLAGVDADLAQD